MQARRVELSIRIATKMCFLKYSNGSVATGTFSPGRTARRAPDEKVLPSPNANSATPQRIASHRLPSFIFKGNSFAVHRQVVNRKVPRGHHIAETRDRLFRHHGNFTWPEIA
jgi:hypothetical protein